TDHHALRAGVVNTARAPKNGSASTATGLEPRFVARRLEQFDRIARRVVDQDLLAADAGDDLVAEFSARVAQGRDQPLEIGYFDREAIPATWLGPAPVGHGLRAAARAPGPARHAEHQPQISA